MTDGQLNRNIYKSELAPFKGGKKEVHHNEAGYCTSTSGNFRGNQVRIFTKVVLFHMKHKAEIFRTTRKSSVWFRRSYLN